MKEITVDAIKENVVAVTEFVESELEMAGCPMKPMMQINVAIDEMYSNVSLYAYGDKSGKVTVKLDILSDPDRAVITFEDEGIPYNPLEKDDPDVTLSADEREIGGLGIFLVKKTMTDVLYEYKDGKNCLTLVKHFA